MLNYMTVSKVLQENSCEEEKMNTHYSKPGNAAEFYPCKNAYLLINNLKLSRFDFNSV